MVAGPRGLAPGASFCFAMSSCFPARSSMAAGPGRLAPSAMFLFQVSRNSNGCCREMFH